MKKFITAILVLSVFIGITVILYGISAELTQIILAYVGAVYIGLLMGKLVNWLTNHTEK